ncbi:MAG TPA: hypothetical protein VK153_01250 [Candidatus Paceibacterota bacterium]|nr:hypothetical protein [Candidatus Paceibacterota bacterium]
MEIKELDKKQFILLTLLITFVVSIATGIVTVSLMNQMPKSVPQTINNVIQRTIEKVTTVQVPAPATENSSEGENNKKDSLLLNNGDALVSIYLKDKSSTTVNSTSTSDQNNNKEENKDVNTTDTSKVEPTAIGQGVIISDIGLILVDSSILGESELYKVVLDKIDFDATVLKKFNNGFAILKISAITDKEVTGTPVKTDTNNITQ